MFTIQLQNILEQINPGDRPGGYCAFPSVFYDENKQKVLRLGAADTIHEWFKRIVDNILGGDPDACTVEANLAVFIVIHWDNRIIQYASVQVLWAEASLLDFYCDEHLRSQYFRLDYEPPNLGPIFKESLPHIHVAGNGEPRFPLHYDETGDIVGAFFDFIYRNYYHPDWLSWASKAWNNECKKRSRPNAWDRIVRGYEKGEYGFLEQNHRDDVLALKKVLVETRRQFFPLRARRELCQLLSYP